MADNWFPPQDGDIINEINNLQYSDIKFEAKESLIELIDIDVDDAFAKASIKNGSFGTTQESKDNLKIVFTSLHGTSITMVPKVLNLAGYKNVSIVKEQEIPNGDFPTVVSPNPEEPEALKMAINLALKEDADIVIGTDPDCDRLGIAVKNSDDGYTLLNGNQAMIVKTYFLLEQWKKHGKLNGNQFVASTIVSTPMIQEIAKDFNVIYKEGLTGFKWIAKMINDFPELEHIGGGEESFGYLVGDFVRDKDAVTATLLICEIAAQIKLKGGNLLNYLEEIFTKYGYYQEHLISIVKKGKKGAEEISEMMKNFRENPYSEIAGSKVVRLEDYQLSKAKNFESNTSETIDIPKSNVLIYYTEDGSKIAMRPSGTEPKIKFYISVNTKSENSQDAKNVLQNKLDAIITVLNKN